jgi:hypothetical protein
VADAPDVTRSITTRRPGSLVAAALRATSDVVLGGIAILAATVAAPLFRRRYNRWGADAGEVVGTLPGDELVPAPQLGYTRGTTVGAPVEAVWPWIAQLGQGRGGLYSYDGLENLFGCGIHSAHSVLPAHQDVRPGDFVRLGPDGYPSFRVQEVTAPTALVLVSTGPAATNGTGGSTDADAVATWQWVLRPVEGGRRTRLLVRQRLTYPRSQRLLWHIVEPIGFVMERRMLRGIKRRAERGQQARHPRRRSRASTR